MWVGLGALGCLVVYNVIQVARVIRIMNQFRKEDEGEES
jgi:hypothetical protein